MNRPEDKLVQERLGALRLAEALGNVAEACRRYGISRTQFYEYKHRFQAGGLAALGDLPPVHKSHPQTTPPDVLKKILDLSLKNPLWGCVRLSDRLKRMGIPVSSPTIQKILLANDLGFGYQRLLRLEEKALGERIELTREQIRAIEQINPCFKERHMESSRPGELLSQDTLYVGFLQGIGKVYLQAVVDTYGSYAFAGLHTGKLPEHAAAVIDNRVLPQYEEWGVTVSAILTDDGKEYCGMDRHPFKLCLARNGVEHRTVKFEDPHPHGFIERFSRTIIEEFLQPYLRVKVYGSIKALQDDLDIWLKHYNEERPHRGYRNMGKSPMDTVLLYLLQVREED